MFLTIDCIHIATTKLIFSDSKVPLGQPIFLTTSTANTRRWPDGSHSLSLSSGVYTLRMATQVGLVSAVLLLSYLLASSSVVQSDARDLTATNYLGWPPLNHSIRLRLAHPEMPDLCELLWKGVLHLSIEVT